MRKLKVRRGRKLLGVRDLREAIVVEALHEVVALGVGGGDEVVSEEALEVAGSEVVIVHVVEALERLERREIRQLGEHLAVDLDLLLSARHLLQQTYEP